MDRLRYPIGQVYEIQDKVTLEQKERWMGDIAASPVKIRQAIYGLSPEQLDTPYRPGVGRFDKWSTI